MFALWGCQYIKKNIFSYLLQYLFLSKTLFLITTANQTKKEKNRSLIQGREATCNLTKNHFRRIRIYFLSLNFSVSFWQESRPVLCDSTAPQTYFRVSLKFEFEAGHPD